MLVAPVLGFDARHLFSSPMHAVLTSWASMATRCVRCRCSVSISRSWFIPTGQWECVWFCVTAVAVDSAAEDPIRSCLNWSAHQCASLLACSLATRHAAREAAAIAAGRAVAPQRSSLQGLTAAEAVSGLQGTADLEAGTATSGAEEGGGGQPSLRRSGSERYLGETFGSSVNSSLQLIGYGLLEASTAGKGSISHPALLFTSTLRA